MVAPSINLTDFVHPRPLLPMVFFKVTAQSQQQLSTQWDDPTVQPHWDELFPDATADAEWFN
jgi:hypothetical protein